MKFVRAGPARIKAWKHVERYRNSPVMHKSGLGRCGQDRLGSVWVGLGTPVERLSCAQALGLAPLAGRLARSCFGGSCGARTRLPFSAVTLTEPGKRPTWVVFADAMSAPRAVERSFVT